MRNELSLCKPLDETVSLRLHNSSGIRDIGDTSVSNSHILSCRSPNRTNTPSCIRKQPEAVVLVISDSENVMFRLPRDLRSAFVTSSSNPTARHARISWDAKLTVSYLLSILNLLKSVVRLSFRPSSLNSIGTCDIDHREIA